MRYLGYKSFSEDTYKYSYYDLQHMEVHTDRGFFMKSYDKETAAGIQFEGHELRPRKVSNKAAPYWTIRAWAGDERIEIKRNYIMLYDLFVSISAVSSFVISIFIVLLGSYNEYKINRDMILNVILGKEELYEDKYKLRKGYFDYWLDDYADRSNCCCC